MALDTREISINRFVAFTKRGTRDLRLLALAAFCVWFGFGAYMASVTNFAVELLHIQPYQQGIVESMREIPGLLLVLIVALTIRVAEPRLGAISLALVGAGIAAYSGVRSFQSLVLYSLVWSVGIHIWMTIQPSIALSLADENHKGRRLGQISAVSAFGTILGMALVFLAGDVIGMRAIFVVAGAVIFIGAVMSLLISKDIGHKEKPCLVWKRRYSLYYALTFLEGCRKQIFMTFAIFALVRNYGTPMRTVAALMVLNSVVNVLLAPRVGKLIDRIGEKKVLTFCYTALIPVFIGYALIRQPHVLYVFYCLDNLFFLGSIGLTTYLNKIADPGDLMPSLAMGVSMNHIAAVAVPVIGGYLWTRFDYPTTFLGGAVVVAISVIFASRIRTNTVPS